jgi:uncharacterized protein (DUF2147 family)
MGSFRSTAFGLAAALSLGLGWGTAAFSADLAGTTWATEGGGAHVAFVEEGDELVGRVAWLRREAETGEPLLDAANPDESLQSRPLMGVEMVWGFDAPEGEVWDGGKIYAPDSGKTYNAKMTLEGDALVVMGCIRWPACREQTWTRVLPAVGVGSITPQ